MYDTENVEFKFSRLRGDLKVTPTTFGKNAKIYPNALNFAPHIN